MKDFYKIGDLDVSILNLGKLVETLFDLEDHPWRASVEIIPEYMPTYPAPSTKPICAIRFTDNHNNHSFLRYSKGPGMGCFWDCYGDDFHSPELALRAILLAPTPRAALNSEVCYAARTSVMMAKKGIFEE